MIDTGIISGYHIPMSGTSPNVIVLAGPNGAGKTTAARTLLAQTLKVMTYVNADVIAQGLAGFDPDSAAIEASRIMLERLHALPTRAPISHLKRLWPVGRMFHG
jgi:ABC-type cobalamin/Fe3+-siderophores transport system ATPase subunit